MAYIDFDSVSATADAYMSSAASNTNYGTAEGMYVAYSQITGESTSLTLYSYVGFDLPTIRWSPTGCLLRLYIEECTFTSDQSIKVELAADDTEENTVTYYNFSFRSVSVGSVQTVVEANSAPGTIVEFDVSRLLRGARKFNLTKLKIVLRQYEINENLSHEYVRFGTKESGHPAVIIISEAVLVTEKRYCYKDAYVDSLNPTVNSGTGKLFVTNVPTRYEFYDLLGNHYPEIPAHRMISYIGINLTGYYASRHGAVDLHVVFTLDEPNSFTLERQEFVLVRCTSSWGEETITWNTAPGANGYGVETAYYEIGSNELRIPYGDATIYLDDFWGSFVSADLTCYLALNSVNSSPYYQMVFFGRHETPSLSAHAEIIFPASPFATTGKDRYVDGFLGSNDNDGVTPETPWRTMDYCARHTPALSSLHVKNDFYQEPIDGIMAPLSMPSRWVNWVTSHSRIMPSIKSPPPVTIYPTDDTFISNWLTNGDIAQGTSSVIELTCGNGVYEEGFLKFDISSIERASDKYYKLYMELTFSYNPEDNPMEFYIALKTNNWNEETLTYNNNETSDIDPSVAYAIWEVPNTDGVYSVDVTSIFRKAVALGYTECSIGICFNWGYSGAGSESISYQFYTKEIAWMGVTIPHVVITSQPT